jgi:lipopolysaccharide transport system ATP-binding protein
MGILGQNGSGKSTLLKILSRITAPTHGRACIRGNVTSLLEVGTGFHQELTGRENVYLNGSILGMKRREITQRFDEIVAFSEVEKFIDTPVKRYSSGMRVRLAFAVAAHLECDIMIIDEVLAVGDLRFQERCMDKLRNARADGRTILFVSHDGTMVKKLCDKGAVLGGGHVRYLGTAKEASDFYMASLGITEPVPVPV